MFDGNGQSLPQSVRNGRGESPVRQCRPPVLRLGAAPTGGSGLAHVVSARLILDGRDRRLCPACLRSAVLAGAEPARGSNTSPRRAARASDAPPLVLLAVGLAGVLVVVPLVGGAQLVEVLVGEGGLLL